MKWHMHIAMVSKHQRVHLTNEDVGLLRQSTDK